MPAVRITPPAPLVTLDLLKADLRIDHDEEDAYLSAVILPAAVDAVERFTGRALVTQRWRLTLDRWPGGPVRLPRPPLAGVVSVRVRTADGVVELAADTYRADPDSTPGRLVPASGTAWPALIGGPEIVYDAGYGPPEAVPAEFVAAVLAVAGHRYANREGAATLPPDVKRELAARRVVWFGDCP